MNHVYHQMHKKHQSPPIANQVRLQSPQMGLAGDCSHPQKANTWLPICSCGVSLSGWVWAWGETAAIHTNVTRDCPSSDAWMWTNNAEVRLHRSLTRWIYHQRNRGTKSSDIVRQERNRVSQLQMNIRGIFLKLLYRGTKRLF